MATFSTKVMIYSFAALFLWLGFAYLFKPFFNTKMGNNLHCEEGPVVGPPKPKTIGKRYGIISGSIPDFANNTVYIDEHGKPQSSPRAWGYAYNLPMTTLAWKRMGFDALVVMTVDTSKIDEGGRRLWRYIDKTIRHFGGTPLYFDVPTHMKTRLGQVLRLVVGDLGLNDDDFVMTGDADYWPLLRSRLEIRPDKDVLILNAYCCGQFVRKCFECIDGHLYREYPLLNVGMRAKEWRTIMGQHLKAVNQFPANTNFTYADIEPMMERIKLFEGENYKKLFNVWHGNHGWSLDQQWFSVLVEKYFYYYGYARGQFEKKLPCHRMSTIGWPKQLEALLKGEITCLSDAHVHKAEPYKVNAWKAVRPFARRFFDDQTMADLDAYRIAFHNAIDFKKYNDLPDFLK